MARITPQKRDTAEEEAVKASHAYLLAKAEADRAAAHAKVLRDVLFAKLEAVGEADENGHVRFALPQAVNGVAGLVKQRRVSRSLDEETARDILAKVGLESYCIKTVEVIDQDSVMQALVEGLLSEEDVDAMFPPKVSYAMTTEKEK